MSIKRKGNLFNINTSTPASQNNMDQNTQSFSQKRKLVDLNNNEDSTCSNASDINSSNNTNEVVDDIEPSNKTKTTYEYFTRHEETLKWICKECNGSNIRKYSIKTSKSTLDYHLEHDHDIVTPKTKRNMSGISKEKSDVVDRALLILIIACCLPFVIVESKAFVSFVASLNPDYKLPCRKKLRSLLSDLYLEKVEILKSKLPLVKSLSITTDGYTSCQNYSYISATAHFISEKTNFISFCLGFAYVNGRHQAEDLKDALQKIFDNYKMEGKIMGIVSDNAPNIRNALTALKVSMGIEPIRCMAHVLQLVVKNVIELIDNGDKDDTAPFYHISKTLIKCRKIVTAFNHSSQLNDLVEQTQIDSGVEKKNVLRLIQDVKTRWHSTFLMAQRMVKLHQYIKTIFTTNQQYKEMRKLLLDEMEMNNLKETVKALECFNDVSVQLSGDTYVTCSLIIPSCKYIQRRLKKNNGNANLINELKSTLSRSLDNYVVDYEIESDYLLCATFLDPNYKDFSFYETVDKKRNLKKVKEYLMDFYTKKKISELVVLEKDKNKAAKKSKLTFNDDDDDDDDEEDISLHNDIQFDLKKEISAYTKLQVNVQDVLDFWR